MWAPIFCLALIAAVSAKNLTFNGEQIDLNSARIQGVTVLQVADMATLRFMSLLYDYKQGSRVGDGVIINKYFVLVTYGLAYDYYSKPSDLDIYSGYLDPFGSLADDTVGTYRFGRETFYQTEYNSNNPIINDLGLIRICPGYTSEYFSIPTPGFVSSLNDLRVNGAEVYLYKFRTLDVSVPDYVAPLHRGIKYVGEKCECTYVSDFWVTDYHVCLSWHNDIYGVASDDLNRVIATEKSTNKILGFLMTYQGDWGEIVLWADQATQRTWYTDNSVTAPYDYPV